MTSLLGSKCSCIKEKKTILSPPTFKEPQVQIMKKPVSASTNIHIPHLVPSVERNAVLSDYHQANPFCCLMQAYKLI
jgi:hypothetical protein